MNNNFTNFFGEGMKGMMDPETFKKYCGNSNFDFTKFSEKMRENTQALQEASTVAVESMQSLCKRASEIAQDNATNAFNAMKEIASSKDAEEAIARQQQFVQNIVHEAVSNTREIVNTATKAATEVFDTISKHASDNISSAVHEVKKATGKK